MLSQHNQEKLMLNILLSPDPFPREKMGSPDETTSTGTLAIIMCTEDGMFLELLHKSLEKIDVYNDLVILIEGGGITIFNYM